MSPWIIFIINQVYHWSDNKTNCQMQPSLCNTLHGIWCSAYIASWTSTPSHTVPLSFSVCHTNNRTNFHCLSNFPTHPALITQSARCETAPLWVPAAIFKSRCNINTHIQTELTLLYSSVPACPSACQSSSCWVNVHVDPSSNTASAARLLPVKSNSTNADLPSSQLMLTMSWHIRFTCTHLVRNTSRYHRQRYGKCCCSMTWLRQLLMVLVALRCRMWYIRMEFVSRSVDIQATAPWIMNGEGRKGGNCQSRTECECWVEKVKKAGNIMLH